VNMVQNALSRQLKSCMDKHLMDTFYMSEKLLRRNRERLRRKRTWWDSKTLKRDATCMWRTSLLRLLSNNLNSYLASTVKSKVLSSCPKKELLNTPLSAIRVQILLQMLKQSFMAQTWMESSYRSVITKSRNWDKPNKRKCAIKTISRTTRDKMSAAILLNSLTSQRLSTCCQC